MNDDVNIISAVPLWFWGLSAFLMSACVGSFLNVVAARVPRGQSIAWPGSHCFTCGAPIAAHHNIPVLSWFILRGRCHDCRASFSVRYALVELGFALLCTYSVVRAGGPTLQAMQECILYGFLFPLACIDLDTWTLPDRITIPGIVAGLALSATHGLDVFVTNLVCAVLGYAVLRVGGLIGSYVLRKEAMGGGDFMLFALIGAFMGPKALLPVIFLSSLQGSVVGLGMICVRRFERRRRERNEASGRPPVTADQEKSEEGGEEASSKDAAKGSPAATEAVAASPAAEANVEAKAVMESPAEKSEESAGSASGESAGEEESKEDEGSGGMVEVLVPPTEAQKAAVERILRPRSMDDLRTFACKLPDDGWRPDAHALPFGPFLALATIELVVFQNLGRMLFPW